MNWQPIKTAPIPSFSIDRWFIRGDRVLVWNGMTQIASFQWTKQAKGRWKSDSGYVISPSLWQPLPESPK